MFSGTHNRNRVTVGTLISEYHDTMGRSMQYSAQGTGTEAVSFYTGRRVDIQPAVQSESVIDRGATMHETKLT